MIKIKKIIKKCEHGKNKFICKECGGKGICIHDKIKSYCKECGGSQICIHDKIRYKCKECGGGEFCVHDKNKHLCKECGGSQLCVHEKRKDYCKDCGGTQICIHGISRYTCKECSNKAYCSHGVYKGHCKECKGSQVCPHNKIKSGCKDCSPHLLCIHNKRPAKCRECGGSAYCEHDKIQSRCRECGGGSFCMHDKRKSYCKECGGSAYCKHDKYKTKCKECGGKALCKSKWCDKLNSKKYKGYCQLCFIHLFPEQKVSRNYKTKEGEVLNRIKEVYPNLTWVIDKMVQDGCSKRRPDLLLDMGTHIIIIEIDENKHTSYDCSCENKRLMELSQDVGHRPIVFIRFNPDAYTDITGNKISSCWKINSSGMMSLVTRKLLEWEERIKTLKTQIQYWIDNSSEKTIEIIELYY